ncbi:MAG: amidase [Solirubrobacteraceae bacterium]
MPGDDVAFAGVAGQVELVRSGAVSARELVELSLSRIERIDPELNSFAAVYGERARQQAGEADALVAKGDVPPLIGIPIAVKDEIDIAGEVTSRGTAAYTTPAPADADVVRRVRAAGAIVIGKTKMPELGLWPFTESITWGVTRNPWDLERTPGGSSGGSAAAVAAGLVPAALAVDGAGSIRIPAACCGLFGLKPQRNRVPTTPHFPDGVSWVVFGTVTRSVLDTAVMLDVLSPQSTGFAHAARTRPGKLRVAVVRGLPLGAPGRLSNEVSDSLERAADLLVSLGHTVVEQKINLRPQDTAVILGLMFRFVRELVLDVERPQRLERRTRSFARAGALISDGTKARLLRAQEKLAERLGRLFDDHDVLLTPMMSETAVPAGIMEGRGATATYLWESGWVPFAILWNLTGQPAASVPAGFAPNGLPLAVQIVGRANQESTLLSLAAQIETERPWSNRPLAVAGM